MRSVSEYQNHFNRELSSGLIKFEEQRKGIINKVILSKLFSLVAIMMFLSLFMGFLNAFPFDEFGSMVILIIFQGFFYLILGVIVMMLVYKALSYVLLVKGANEILKDKQKLYLYTAIVGIVVMICAFFTGKLYMGERAFNVGFFLRYLLGIITIIVFGALSNIFSKYEKRFNLDLKAEILPKILKYIRPELKYDPIGFIKQSDFEDSRIYPNRQVHSFKGSDFVTGSYGEGLFAFSELDVMEITRTRSAGKSETKITQLFKGLFYVANFNKSFSGKTVIYPDYARSLLGAQFGEMLNQAIGVDNTHLVRLEDTEFEKEFAVYSTDQVEARYILSPTMIERLMLIKQKIERDLYISFIHDRIYIAMPCDIEFLTPLIFRDMTQFETMEPIYYGIDALIDIAQDLHLNTRIWGKV
jgi:hypothetical protein